jgi:hypothetical protein
VNVTRAFQRDTTESILSCGTHLGLLFIFTTRNSIFSGTVGLDRSASTVNWSGPSCSSFTVKDVAIAAIGRICRLGFSVGLPALAPPEAVPGWAVPGWGVTTEGVFPGGASPEDIPAVVTQARAITSAVAAMAAAIRAMPARARIATMVGCSRPFSGPTTAAVPAATTAPTMPAIPTVLVNRNSLAWIGLSGGGEGVEGPTLLAIDSFLELIFDLADLQGVLQRKAGECTVHYSNSYFLQVV